MVVGHLMVPFMRILGYLGARRYTARCVLCTGRNYAERTMASNKYVCIIKLESILFANEITFRSK